MLAFLAVNSSSLGVDGAAKKETTKLNFKLQPPLKKLKRLKRQSSYAVEIRKFRQQNFHVTLPHAIKQSQSNYSDQSQQTQTVQ